MPTPYTLPDLPYDPAELEVSPLVGMILAPYTAA